MMDSIDKNQRCRKKKNSWKKPNHSFAKSFELTKLCESTKCEMGCGFLNPKTSVKFTTYVCFSHLFSSQY